MVMLYVQFDLYSIILSLQKERRVNMYEIFIIACIAILVLLVFIAISTNSIVRQLIKLNNQVFTALNKPKASAAIKPVDPNKDCRYCEANRKAGNKQCAKCGKTL
jgi:hypothetical protein